MMMAADNDSDVSMSDADASDVGMTDDDDASDASATAGRLVRLDCYISVDPNVFQLQNNDVVKYYPAAQIHGVHNLIVFEGAAVVFLSLYQNMYRSYGTGRPIEDVLSANQIQAVNKLKLGACKLLSRKCLVAVVAGGKKRSLRQGASLKVLREIRKKVKNGELQLPINFLTSKRASILADPARFNLLIERSTIEGGEEIQWNIRHRYYFRSQGAYNHE